MINRLSDDELAQIEHENFCSDRWHIALLAEVRDWRTLDENPWLVKTSLEFGKLAITERNYERVRADRLEAERDALRSTGHELLEALIDALGYKSEFLRERHEDEAEIARFREALGD